VPPDIIGTLFTPFMTIRSNGLGIGLTIVRTIRDAHGGTIAAHNNPEGGASFVVTLPRGETPRIQAESSSERHVAADTEAPVASA
jgi:signal transduction histidine kinase